MRRFTVISAIVWILVISVSFFWNLESAKRHHYDIVLQSARSLFAQLVTTREWNARHGGVYVPVSPTTPPNPYLKDPDRDLRINKKLTLTKINPAYMTRQVSQIAAKSQGIHFHITSLKPLNPHNAATKRERKALLLFHKGTKEVGYFLKKGPHLAFFYMAPLLTTKACLKCHAQQGYKLGDIRGGISLTIPSVKEISWAPLLIAHFIIGILGIAGIAFFDKKLNTAYAVLRQQAEIDVLTEIPNRRNFSKRIIEEFKRSSRKGEPISLLFCDIDNFKEFNDTYGHSAGDRCLRRIAQTLKTSLDRPGDFCARYGGEEFVVILPETPAAGAYIIAEKILQNVRELKITHSESPWAPFITISIGIATAGRTMAPATCEDFINQADKALYEAKNRGKNCAAHYTSDPQT